MNRLQTELQRLYPPADEGGVRAMVLELARPATWELLSKVWQGVQADLELPAPAIAVSGIDSYQLWFSLSEPVPAAEATAFLEALRKRYLGDVAPDRIALNPTVTGPPVEARPGHWSAFLAPDLAALFAGEPWLDLPPGLDAQAELLSRLESTKTGDLRRAMERSAQAQQAAVDNLDPRTFLLQVMNDRSTELHLRIEAAKALLPWFEGRKPS